MRSAPLRPADGVIAAVCAVAALLLFVITRTGDEGTQVMLETVGEPPVIYSLDEPVSFTVSGRDGLTLTVEIADGAVRVKDSDCPDRVCVHSGWLSRGGQAAVCVPGGVCLRVIGGENAVDGVTA